MTGDSLYWLMRGALDVTVWGGELVADLELPPRHPAVFVANHAGALGPIAVAASLPIRLHPWIIADMVDQRLAGPYLEKDFVRPELHLPASMAAPLAAALSRLAVPLLLKLGCIPVWRDHELFETLRVSTGLLIQGAHLLIFPEDPALPVNERTTMRPFKTGFAHLGHLYHQREGLNLQFYPIAVHRRRRRVQVAAPISYNALNPEARERRRVAHVLESIIAAMLTEGGEPLSAGVSAAP